MARDETRDGGGTRALLDFAESAELAGGNFDGADVSPGAKGRAAGEADGLDLRGRVMTGAGLRSANLSYADLRETDLSEAQGSGLRLRGAQLESTLLTGADLVGADLTEVSAGEANFAGALLEDAHMGRGQFRFASFAGAILEGADLTEADLWGANFGRAALDRAVLRRARLDESSFAEAQMPGADLQHATLRRADLTRAQMENANLREAVLDGANLSGADLTGASLPNLSLMGCDLTGVSFAGAWLERTRMQARQLGGAVGEELSGNLAGAIDSYVVLERNFLSLGMSDDASWAYLRKRRVARRLHWLRCKAHRELGEWRQAAMPGLQWLSDTLAEWLCDYGESLVRVARALVCILVGFALVYWVTGALKPREGVAVSHLWAPVNYMLFSLDSMTTVGTAEVGLRPKGELGVLLSSLQTVLGTILLGLFGFVLGARIRN